MANIDNTGFRPAQMLGGGDIPARMFDISDANATAVFVGDVVTAKGTGTVGPAAADDGTSVVGVVMALYDSNGIPIGHPSSSVSYKYLPVSTAGKALVALAIPQAVFIAQGQSGQTPTAAYVFGTTDHVAGSGSTTTGRSGHELNCSDVNTGAQCLILGKVEDPGNDWGENVDLYVTFHESILGSVDKSVGV